MEFVMEFTPTEKQAVVSLMIGIIEADGWIDEEEIEFADEVLDAIECTDEDFELGQDMPLLPALVTVRRMTDEQKEAVAQVISATIVADRIITLEEAAIFDWVSELTGIDDILDDDQIIPQEELNDLASEAD